MISQSEGFTRFLELECGHNCLLFECIRGEAACKPGTGGSHGQHGLQIRFVLRGPKGAVQFLIFTGWVPLPPKTPVPFQPFFMPADLGYHSPTARYKGQTGMTDCEYIAGGCFYDGSSLNAELPYRTLVNRGEEALWDFLREYYESVFSGGPFPKSREYLHAERKETA